jgi:hypothetical protein
MSLGQCVVADVVIGLHAILIYTVCKNSENPTMLFFFTCTRFFLEERKSLQDEAKPHERKRHDKWAGCIMRGQARTWSPGRFD